MAKRNEQVSVQAAAFELKLPEEFVIKPVHVVDLPGGRKAEIFAADYEQEHWWQDVRTVITTPGWRIVLRDKKGKLLNPRGNNLLTQVFHDCYYRNSSEIITDKLKIAHTLERVVLALSKTKTTQVVEDDPDED